MDWNETMGKNQVCVYAKKCGGCDYQGIDYEKQLAMKQKAVEKLLSDNCKVDNIIGAQNPYHYRNKVHGVFGRDKKGSVYTGIYQEGTHKLIPIENCLIENEIASQILITLSKLVQSFKLKVYDEDRQTGLFRHALIRVGHATGQILVVLVLSSPVFPSKNNFIAALCKAHPGITSVVLNVNQKRTNMILGDKNIVLYGKGYIEDKLCGLTFRISPHSFYQINSWQTEVLYQKALEFAGLTGTQRVIDAYCGIGTIGMAAAAHAGEVIGVELNKAAVDDARVNAKLNGIKNIRFVNDDAGKFMVKMAGAHEKADVVLMDPPRSGSTEEFIDAVRILGPKRVVYISCNPVTLARDLKVFAQKGYRAQRIVPVDMFGFTEHVETVCLLSQITR